MEHFSLEFDTVEKGMIRRAAAARRPINGTLELTPLCNMNCGMCYIRLSREEMERQGRMRTAQEWIQLAKQMEQAGVLYLLLTGGEPLLFPDFQALYLRLKEMGMILTVNTNGTLINEEWAKFFGAHKPRRVNITLYGADDGAYETLCHYPGGFSKTVEAIELLKEQGVAVKINGSVTRENRDDMEAIYRLGRELDAPVHMDTYMLPGLRQRHLPCEKQSRLSPEGCGAGGAGVSWRGDGFLFLYGIREAEAGGTDTAGGAGQADGRRRTERNGACQDSVLQWFLLPGRLLLLCSQLAGISAALRHHGRTIHSRV